MINKNDDDFSSFESYSLSSSQDDGDLLDRLNADECLKILFKHPKLSENFVTIQKDRI